MTKLIRQRQADLQQPLRVLVTGVASGIGQAQAQAFLDQGHRVFGLDLDRPKDLEGRAGFAYLKTDVSQADQVQAAIEKSIAFLGGLDVLCNTAGVLDDYQRLDKLSFEDWQDYLSVNLDSYFLVTKAALPHLLANEASRVINMASIASLTAGGGGIAYTSCKHAIAGFTKQLAYDYSSQGLRANAIAPGAIDTPMNQADFDQGGQMASWVQDQTPVGRWAQAQEVASLALFLASDQADYMQGNIIPLDGGWLIR